VQTENEDRAKEIFRRGYEQAQHLQLAYPEKADGYYWYAVNFGEFVERSSIFTKMAAPGKITAMAKKVLQLDPSYDGGGAYLMLGRINQLMPGGDEKLAEDYFKKSVGYAPNRTTSHLYLAQLYYDEKRYEEAMAEAEIVLSVKPEKRFIVEYRQDVPEAKQWRAKIAEKLGRHRESRRFSPYGRHHAGVAWIFHPARFKISSAQR